MREVLQLSNAELPNGDSHDHHIQIPALETTRQEKIAQAARGYQERLRQRLTNTTQDNTTELFHPEGVILKYVDNYGKHLFGHPTQRDAQGRWLKINRFPPLLSLRKPVLGRRWRR